MEEAVVAAMMIRPHRPRRGPLVVGTTRVVVHRLAIECGRTMIGKLRSSVLKRCSLP